MTIHLLNHKSDNLDIESENEKEGIKRNRNISGSSNSTTSHPMKKPVTVSNLSKDEIFSSGTTSNATADDEFKTKVTVLENKLETWCYSAQGKLCCRE